MRDRPDAAALLDFASAALLRDLAPLLPAERQHEAVLIARAVAIAGREAAAGDAPLRACQAALAELLGEGDLDTLLRRLAAAIRAGAYDAPGPEREDVRRLLWAITVQKLRESNPDYLAWSGADQLPQNGSP
jgi:Domain of unknown function (DUF6285)